LTPPASGRSREPGAGGGCPRPRGPTRPRRCPPAAVWWSPGAGGGARRAPTGRRNMTWVHGLRPSPGWGVTPGIGTVVGPPGLGYRALYLLWSRHDSMCDGGKLWGSVPQALQTLCCNALSLQCVQKVIPIRQQGGLSSDSECRSNSNVHFTGKDRPTEQRRY